MTDQQIAEKFNEMKLKTNKGNAFTINSVEWIRFKHNIPPLQLQKPEELSIKQAANKFNVSHYVIRYWIEYGMISTRRIGKRFWLTIEPEKEIELRKRVESSTKIAKAQSKS